MKINKQTFIGYSRRGNQLIGVHYNEWDNGDIDYTLTWFDGDNALFRHVDKAPPIHITPEDIAAKMSNTNLTQ